MRFFFLLIFVASTASAQTTVRNGGMNDGQATPSGWTVEADEGSAKAFRDVDEKVEGIASLRLESVGGAAKAKALQELKLTAGDRWRISGQAKASGSISYGVVVVLTPGAKQAWNEIFRITPSDDWQRFGKVFQVPSGIERGLLMLYFSGDGAVWLDDLSMLPASDPPAANADFDRVLTDFDQPFLFTYLGFDNSVSHRPGIAVVQTKTSKGGAGINLEKDWSAFADHSPAIRIKLGANNEASQIKLQLTDADKGKTNFTYELAAASSNEFHTLRPQDAKSLTTDKFKASKVTGLHIQGDWSGDRIDVEIDRVEFIEPNTEMLALRKAAAERAARNAERKRMQAERDRQARGILLSSGGEHPADGPEVAHVGAAGANLLGIEIQAGRIPLAAPMKYQAQTGDIQKETGGEKLAWLDGEPAIVQAGYELHRTDSKNGSARKVGQLNLQAKTVWVQKRQGIELDINVVDEPRAYRVSIDGQQPILPAAVYRKSKPNTIAQVSGDVMAVHFVYLQLPRPLQEGSTYTINFFALNTREQHVVYRHEPKTQRSEAIHVSHLGYRRDDPFKRAYLSLWAGTGGGQSFTAKEFRLLDEQGQAVYAGGVRLGVGADQQELFANARNHTLADVYHLDFGDFQRDGRYVVHVPGLGISYPFQIGDSVWQDAFAVSMHGFLTHRSGIELGPPLTPYVRPRNMHPDDGVVVFKTDATIWDGESNAIEASLKRLLGKDLDASKLATHPSAWGGYMDAGDWDRRSQHLICSLRHLELLEMFPETIGKLKLALPPEEAENDIADIMDEALWNIDFYRRLQEPDGGVGGGVESTAHPRPAEASWQESLLIGAFRPDPETTYRYAAVAAKAARMLGDHPRSKLFRDSALRAWDWAQANAEAEIAAAIKRKAKQAEGAAQAVGKMKRLAAIELFRLTDDPRFHLHVDDQILDDTDLAMCYALIPKAKADPTLHQRAIGSIVQTADAAIGISSANGFNVAPPTQYLPMMGYTGIWSTPGSVAPPVLPRAHYLTGQRKYLAGTIAACQYSGGANPMNMSYTTGIGHRQPLAPLHVDSRVSGQTPPAGITVYGQSDPAMGYGFDKFAHTWYLNRYGGVNSAKWPTAEAYIDLGNWPAMNEYTVHQTLSPTSYTWGYLAGRASTK